MKFFTRHLFIFIALCSSVAVFSQAEKPVREHLLMDFNWHFAFGHPYDTKQDFNTGTGYFSYLAKAGYGDGAAAQNFDDRAWRIVNLPHDWAVEQPFDKNGSYSHGFKAIGRNFPNASVGWYRKTFSIPASDLGRHISIAFDGVFRNSMVWVNGHYLGTEPSGYTGFEYNISEYLNYGGENTVAVRADATMEEGWFYEGAGIYRHVWLNKTSPLHITPNGTFVTSKVANNAAIITAQVSLINQSTSPKTIAVQQTVTDKNGKTIATNIVQNITLGAYEEKDISSVMNVATPHLWSLDTPYLHKLVTTIISGDSVLDNYETTFGIRTIRFDANEGFFLNGKHIKIHGTDNHQDHAGVGVAMPDALIEYRVKALKAFGCNAFRCSHNLPAPELLDACDKYGMLVIDENRLMGVTDMHFSYLKRMMVRDRNHPSIISWSIGNEEWAIEGNIFGARIATTMQAYAKTIDTTRAITAAISGGWRQGISNVIDVMGANYIAQINTDEQHAKFPNQPIWGTEEGSTNATRGVYVDDRKNNMLAAYDKPANANAHSIEEGWKHYAERNYLGGMFIWTGFDYRGEPTPFGFPSITSYFGMLDLCGFAKDDVYYLKSWWMNEPIVHILPHWNRAKDATGHDGKEGDTANVWVYSNCDEVELFVNKKSMGKQTMQANSHLEWKVKYSPGTVEAIGYKKGKKIASDKVQTTGEPVAINLAANRTTINADKEDAAMITVEVKDKNNLHIPTANNDITFSIEGGKIIGAGNGNPTSLEPDKYIETVQTAAIENMKEKIIDSMNDSTAVAAGYDDSRWNKAFTDDRTAAFGEKAKAVIYRSNFTLPQNFSASAITLFYKPIGKAQNIYINGHLIANSVKEKGSNTAFVLDKTILHTGSNSLVIIAAPILKKQTWDAINMNPGIIQIKTLAATWKRKLFSGLAQVIVQADDKPGAIKLTAISEGLKPATIIIQGAQTVLRPAVASSE